MKEPYHEEEFGISFFLAIGTFKVSLRKTSFMNLFSVFNLSPICEIILEAGKKGARKIIYETFVAVQLK